MLRFFIKSTKDTVFPLLSFGNVLKGGPPIVFKRLSKLVRGLDIKFISRRTISSQDGVKRKNRPPGGARMLTDPNLVFMFNNWDNVEWDKEQEKDAHAKVEANSRSKLPPEAQEKYETHSGHYWNEFYAQHQNRFFKDRHWLFTEFPELAPIYEDKALGQVSDLTPKNEKEGFPGEHAAYRIFEVGCGVGNTVFPIIQTSNDPNLFVYCCDLSANAIQLVQENSDYNEKRCHAFVGDVSDPSVAFPFPAESIDVIVLIFVLSAINPVKLSATIQRLSKLLKPGGLIVFRDYGRYDLTQLRFKAGRCLADNFYVRGDGTKVYYFTQEELRTLFIDAGLNEEQNLIDRRLQVNRGRQLKMYRVWIQCKYRKPKVEGAP